MTHVETMNRYDTKNDYEISPSGVCFMKQWGDRVVVREMMSAVFYKLFALKVVELMLESNYLIASIYSFGRVYHAFLFLFSVYHNLVFILQ